MIAYNAISPEYKALITGYTMPSDRQNCDLSFSNLCSWRFLYSTLFAIVDECLILKFFINNKPIYMMPISPEEKLPGIVGILIEEAHQNKQLFRMAGVCNDARIALEHAMPGTFDFIQERDYADYLYLRDDLVNLQGKKYQSKRNHLNQFHTLYPRYSYKELVPSNIQDCKDLEAIWYQDNSRIKNGTGIERNAINYALNHFEELGLTGGIIYVNEQIAAFTFGMPINHNTFGIHVEKADANIKGVYTMINREFAQRIPQEYTYINREEDLGIEGLRKAKLSYHPVCILPKYIARLKNEPAEDITW